MKVDVNIIKRPGVKVEINLARGSRRGRRVSVPVRVAPYLAEEFPEEEPLVISEEPDENDLAEDELVEDPCEECSQDDDIPEEEVLPDEADADCSEIVTEDALYENDPDEEDLLRLIEEEEAEMAASSKPEHTEPLNSHYMSYIDRSENGEVFEVDDSNASGQKIVCVDNESGRLSRVCGFIKNNQSSQAETAQPTETESDGE